MRKSFHKAFLLAVALLSAATDMQGVPAYGGPIEVPQPDGTTVTVRLFGDEHRHWTETPDGYTLLVDQDGWWTFARKMDDGSVGVSGLRYRNESEPARAAGITPGLRVGTQGVAKAASSELQVDESFPTTGKRKLLMLLVNYSDTQPIFTQSDFDGMMNAGGYGGIGSFRDYYLNASYGKLDIETTVTRWVTLPYEKSYYGSEGAIAMIRDALTRIDGEIDLREFDNDGDGILDGLAVIHQGAGQEYTANQNDIWSHSSTIYGMEFDGIQVRRYTIEPELLGTTGRMSTIGVVCHEFGHNLGAPDFYDTDYDSSGGDYPGTGVWDLMGSGAWNGDKGDRPAGINMWQKIQMGWCSPVLLTESTVVDGMLPADEAPVAYRFDTTVPGEYFILENRQQSGVFDRSLPGHGLLIYHVSETRVKNTVDENTLNVTFPQAMYTVCARSGCEPDSYPSSYGNVNSGDAPFSEGNGVESFSDRTLPSAKSIDGRYSYKALSGITETADGEISFTFTSEPAPASPEALTVTASRGVVWLSWRMPDGADAPDHFSVYRNGEMIGSTDEMQFTDDGITTETDLSYYVDATYSNGLTSPYTEASVRIPANFVEELSAAVTGDDTRAVDLTWGIGTYLSRNTGMENSELVDYNVSTVDYVHRFTAADLSVYKGYKVRRIGFMPAQGPRDASFSLRVWEADADGSNPVIVTERAVSEFGAFSWNDLVLTKSIEISGQKELWLGVRCESSTGVVQIINDRSGNGAGRGNWIRIADGEWMEDTQTDSNYFLRFTLVEPELSDPVAMPDTDGPVDPAVDMAFPLGFSVYRDDQYIGSTGNCRFIDTDPLAGVHTYSVSSCYKGFNESVAASVDVTVDRSGITESAVGGRIFTVQGRTVLLHGYDGPLSVYDICGRVVISRPDYRAGDALTLSPGLYIVKAGTETFKVDIF